VPRLLLVVSLAGLLAATAAHGDVSFVSGARQVGLLELYTSEGCSSCPPADRWLTALGSESGLWRDFVPVAFHVDYWDYLGWKDRFASPDYSARQGRYARHGGLATVYTPGVVYNGRELRDWQGVSGHSLPAGGRGGLLRADVSGDRLLIQFRPTGNSPDPLFVEVALLGGALTTAVGAGENRGRTLRHDFVVLAMERQKLRAGQTAYTGEVPLPVTGVRAPRRALAVWISTGDGDLRPLQATGGWLE